MVFKLVRTDSAEPYKIQLPVGKHLIGRGKFLDCEDKRVSRNHGELLVTSDTVVIKALHQNPCFITRKGAEDTQILKLDCTSDLTNGDKFGLLPDSHWFELIHCAVADVDHIPVNAVDIANSNEAVEKNQEADDTNSTQTEPMDQNDGDKNNESQLLDLNMNDTVDTELPGSPSLLAAENQQPIPETSTEQSTNENLPEGSIANETEGIKEIKTENSPSPPKRCHSPDKESSDDSVKKIKTEPDVKKEPDTAQAGPSNDQGSSNSNDINKDAKAQQVPPNPALRERCMYGASCYRRNIQHKAEFSHPTDADWGPGAQAPCPHGSGCRKADPRHWHDHSHPPDVRQPLGGPNLPPNHAGFKRRKPKQKRRDSSDDNDDSPTPNLIVQGKRPRKTIVRGNNWSGSESEQEEDPFGTDDESDEWQPTSDMTDSQLYTQDFT